MTDGTSIYLTRDIGGAIERYEKYKFDKMIYVVSSQQDLHLQQFFKVLSLLEYPWADRLQHVNYGLVQGMSTRKGTAVFLDDIIREASEIMHEQMKKNADKYSSVEDPEGTSREIGITAIKIQDMAAKRSVVAILVSCLMIYPFNAELIIIRSTGRECSLSRETRGLISNTPTSGSPRWLVKTPTCSHCPKPPKSIQTR